MIEVIDPGPLTTVQDLGRRGFAHLGVPPSGAADIRSLMAANRVVGNDPAAAALEVTFGGLRLHFLRSATVCVSGAPPAGVVMNTSLDIPAGGELRLRVPRYGVRTYVAVRGGIDVPRVLGSRSTDVLSGLGPAPLRAGDELHAGDQIVGAPDDAAADPLDPTALVPVIAGPRPELFDPDVLAHLAAEPYTVTPSSNRVAVRLSGRVVRRATAGEQPPEGLVTGAVQVPHDGRPLVFLSDHPTTGGYPVCAVVTDEGIRAVAQARPGAELRFVPAP